jgi:glutamate 5-kinase
MITKLIAADLATAAGVTTVITHGSKTTNICKIISSNNDDNQKAPSDTPLHTKFTAKNNPMLDRKWWILHGLHTAGTIYIDTGAAKAVVTPGQRSSLFAAGIVDVQGKFNAQQAVQICLRQTTVEGDKTHLVDVAIGKGLVNYSSAEISRIKQCNSSEIAGILGYVNADCVIHRDNLVRVAQEQEIS